MRTDKDQAFNLRKQGKSYKEIALIMNVAKSTLSNWFKGVDFLEDIKKTIAERANQENSIRLKNLNKARGDILTAYYVQAEKEAVEELKKYIGNPLFVSGIVAYWGEGDKSQSSLVRLANSDARMIKLFYDFLITFCDIKHEKIRGALYLYDDLVELECKKYWENNTGLKYFHKTMILPSRHKTKKLPFGTCTVLVSNTYLKRKMLLWIDQLPKMVLNTVPSGIN